MTGKVKNGIQKPVENAGKSSLTLGEKVMWYMDNCLQYIIKNKPLPSHAEAVANALIQNQQQPLFIIVGDLDLKGNYADSALIFTKQALIYCESEKTDPLRIDFARLSSVSAKRMYGNATLSAVVDGKERQILFRYTYSVATLCDAAALFVNHLNHGADFSSEFAVVEAAFEKALRICPKCGRTLLHPGSECINCRSKLKVVKYLSRYIAPQYKTIIFCIFLSLFTTTMSLVPPTVTGFIVDVVFGEKSSSNVPLLNTIADVVGGDSLTLLFTMIGFLFASYILQYGVGILRAYLMRMVGDKMVFSLRNDIYRKAQHLPMKFYDKTSTGAVITRLSGDSATILQFMLRITQEAVVHFFQLIGIIVIMLSLNPSLTLLSLVPVVFIAIVVRIFSKKMRPFYHRIWRKWSAVLSNMSDTIPCVRVVKSFSGEKRTSEKFEMLNHEWLKIDLKLGKLVAAFPQLISFLVTCGSLIIWATGGTKVVQGAPGFSAGLVVSFISYASMFYNPVTFFANLSDSFQSTMASVEKILDVLEAEPEPQAPSPVTVDKLEGKIEFLHVGFSFDRSKKVLDDVSFTIQPGEIVGIVGTTGSGKSTLINLLMRFYDGYSGEILVDGHNIKNLELSSFREQIGFVQQEPMMFSDTIYHNIAYGNPKATVDEVMAAADIANAHEFIAKQPDGYDTVLGERGVGVSGGEKQRISIARAVLKNPSIMIFDEATASVDSETEHLIQEAIDRLITGKTTLMIAHRLSTLKKATRIIVVDNGKIIENGSPQELLAKKGKYYKLVQIQSMAADAKRMQEEAGLS